MKSGGRVTTKRKRTTTYLEEDIHALVENAAIDDGVSASNWIEYAIKMRLNKGTVPVDLDERRYEKLSAEAQKGYRSLSDQILMIIDQWLDSKD